MRGITTIAVLVLVSPAFAQGERHGPDRPGPDARRGGGIEQKLEQILHRLERLEQRVEQRDADRDGPRAEHGNRGRRGPDRRRGDSRRGPDFRGPDSFRGPQQGGPQGGPGPDAAAPMAQFRRLMQAAKQGDERAQKILGHMRDAINKTLGAQAKPDAKAKAKKQKRAKATKTAKGAAPAASQLEVRLIKPDALETAQIERKVYTVVTESNNANNRRAAAIKLLSKSDNDERAARVRDLRMKAQALQAEIEALRAQLEK